MNWYVICFLMKINRIRKVNYVSQLYTQFKHEKKFTYSALFFYPKTYTDNCNDNKIK